MQHDAYLAAVPSLLLHTNHKADGLSQVPWTEDIRPKFQHYPEFGESAFEKYYRVIAASRRCAKVVLSSKSYHTVIGQRVTKHVSKHPQPGQESPDVKHKLFWISISFERVSMAFWESDPL